ncbi:hypothetical protein [Sphingobacterium siyangense]|uniref:Uncharacterized protein n=1 Tax=Sphingobacterium siyangense TaxID=459529 RepID=A0A562M6A0_9SPHI|nr:hypothetical protein [Sphingobacterium siyangense]TWI15459.1 hypothetical protein IQ31_05117 [Sphingobacterium siyangense]
MKKIIFFAAAIIGSVTAANAQSQSQAKVKVNVELKPFQSIEIGSGKGTGNDGAVTDGYDDEVTLKYQNINDYTNGVEKSVLKQLKVSSVGSGYRVKATLSSPNFTKTAGAGATVYDAKKLLEIQVGGKSVSTDINMDFGPIGENSNAGSSVLNNELDVKYIGKPLNETAVTELLGKNGDRNTIAKYTIDVVYTIAAN